MPPLEAMFFYWVFVTSVSQLLTVLRTIMIILGPKSAKIPLYGNQSYTGDRVKSPAVLNLPWEISVHVEYK